ncbi:MAG: ATP-binding protein [Lachnospiraceae bacterium]|nr:ATP-binding protein [Lachnospiraceae bacterium]
MVQYRKAQLICLLQYTVMLLLHIIYGYFYCSHGQFLKTFCWSVFILLFIGICTFLPNRNESLVNLITFVSVIISAYYVGVVLHTLAFAALVYLVTILVVSLYLNRHYIVFFGVLSILAEISFMIFFPDILMEMVPSLFLYGCYIFCYILGVVNLYFLVLSGREYMEQMKIKTREAQEAAAYKGQFLANVSHEIRTPMNVICGMTQMLSREEMSAQAREYTDNIDRASKVLLSLINDILDLSKIKSDKFEIHEGTYSLKNLIDDVSNLMAVKIDSQKVRFVVEQEAGLPEYLYGDEDRLKQILINILNNAIKFTSEGEIRFLVKGESAEEENCVELRFEISDTGMGIKKKNLEHLFESFGRFEESSHKDIEGTGLGLNICDSLIKRMNGSISVESEYGKGTTFYIHVPQTVSAEPDVEKVQGERWTAPGTCVLVVDDTKTNYFVVKNLLSLFEIPSDYAKSGMEALQKMEEKRYDLVLLDHMMPEMDGEETLREIKARRGERFENIPIIALTANAAVGGREDYKRLGFSDYISKPVELENLGVILKEYLPSGKVKRTSE